ncbi:MAG: hypothetical protein PHG27_11645 [Massilibacteroides sp.]|nr:hypothetical protein [Massilibacteroides sp.]
MYPEATILAPSSRKYNCHSYAWNLTTGGTINCWVNQTENGQSISNYWNDNSYKSCTESVAQKIFYPSGDHSAIRSVEGGKYDSKWGAYPLMRHAPNYGPYINMNNRQYYTRNVNISGNKLISATGTNITIFNAGTFRTPTQWTYSDNLQLVNKTNTSAVFKSSTNAAGWVRAHFNGYVTDISPVWAGKPVITDVLGERRVPNGQYADYKAVYDNNSSPTQFEWILNPQGRNNLYGTNTSELTIAFYDVGSYQLVVRATNANGTGEYFVTGCNVYNPESYSSSYKVYPNPVSNVLIIDLASLTEKDIQSIKQNNISKTSYDIYLYNLMGSTVKRTKVSDKQQVRMDVTNLPDGYYYLIIDDKSGNESEKQTIIIKH